MGDEQILQEFFQRMVAGGLITVDDIEGMSDSDIEGVLQYLKSGNEAAALSYVQSRGQSVDYETRRLGGHPVEDGQGEVGQGDAPETMIQDGQLFQKVLAGYNGDTPVYKWQRIASAPAPDAPDDVFVGYDYDAVPGWMTPVFERPDGFQYRKQPTLKAIVPDTGEPSPFEREQFEYGKSQDAASAALARQKWEADQAAARRTELNDVWAKAQGYQQAYDKQLADEDAYSTRNRGPWPWPENTATNWINYWKRQNTPVPTTRLGAKSGLRNRLTESDFARARGIIGTNIEKQNIWDPSIGQTRQETDAEYNVRITEGPLGIIAGGEAPQFATSSVHSPWWIPANEDEQNRRDQLVAMGLAQGNVGRQTGQREVNQPIYNNKVSFDENKPLGFDWSPEQRGAVESYMEQYGRRPAGPATPNWAKGVVMAPSKDTVNLRTLGREGNVVRPVSAQTYQNWMPSQREGYAGLVGAQKGANVGDYMDNLGKMWSASRRGQLAVRR